MARWRCIYLQYCHCMDAASATDPALFKYLFDLNGFVVIPDVLDHATCDAAVAAIEQRKIPMEATPNGYESHGTWESAHQLWEAGEPFIRMIDLPQVTKLLQLIIGPLLRLETAYSFVRHKGCPPLEMHGGHRGGGVNFRYSVVGDSIYTGLTVVGFSLQGISEADGGFACIPGSHKSDFHVPEEHREGLWALDGPLVRTVATPKGSAVVFTECLAHGAASWRRDDPRYSLFFKYNDRAATYGYPEERRPTESTLALMSENQRTFFNRAWSANVDGKPEGNPSNTKPEFGDGVGRRPAAAAL